MNRIRRGSGKGWELRVPLARALWLAPFFCGAEVRGLCTISGVYVVDMSLKPVLSDVMFPFNNAVYLSYVANKQKTTFLTTVARKLNLIAPST